jgi:hypothetical protein
MRARHHEIPTHLDVEDKLVFGLTARQFLYVLVGSSLAYGLWEQAATAPSPLRVAVTAACLVVAAALALLRPFGRPLEEWLLASVLFFGSPRSSTWQSEEPDAASWRPVVVNWQDLAPSMVWADEEGP